MNGNEVCAPSPRWDGWNGASLAAFFRRNYSPLNSGFNTAKDIRRAVERNVLCRNPVDEHSLCRARTARKEKPKGVFFPFFYTLSRAFSYFSLPRIPFLFESRLRATNTAVSKGKSILAR